MPLQSLSNDWVEDSRQAMDLLNDNASWKLGTSDEVLWVRRVGECLMISIVDPGPCHFDASQLIC